MKKCWFKKHDWVYLMPFYFTVKKFTPDKKICKNCGKEVSLIKKNNFRVLLCKMDIHKYESENSYMLPCKFCEKVNHCGC